MVEQSIDVDSVLEHAGNFGKYQILLIVLFSFINLISGFHYFGQTFISILPDYKCNVEGISENLTDDKCDIQKFINGTQQIKPCNAWVFHPEKVSGFIGIVQEFSWVCSQDWKPVLGQSMFFIGSVIGSLIFGVLADRIGRLHVLVISNMFALAGNVLTVFSREIVLFIISRFLAGCATDSNFVMMYIIVLEYMKPSMRTMGLNLCIGVFYCLSCVLIPWIAVCLGNWKSLMMFVAAPHLLVLGFYLVVPESAQWLISKGKIDKAIKSFKTVARVNGKTIEESVFEKLRKYNDDRKCGTDKAKHESFLGLLKTRNLRRKTLILIFKSMVLTLCYDAISKNVNGFGYSPFTVFSLTSITILPACLFILAIQDRIGRKALASSSLLIGGIFLIISGSFQALILTSQPTIVISLAIVARLCINVAYNSGAQYAVELIPTVVRGQGVSLIHVVGYAASFFSPQVLYLANFWKPAPDVILGSLMMAGAVACLFLPETLDRILPVSLEDGEEFGEDEGVFDFACCKVSTESTTTLYRSNTTYTVNRQM